ncbi:hypothetical protein ACH436_02210 [Isoptericola sp. NPDC019693]|uniref:hypothetical protein n=1 Tax=Isoptericola sp. NPDC019693 TaxID=3364009 RepID=UPI0037980AA9
MASRRRDRTEGPHGPIDRVPLRDAAEGAPGRSRDGARVTRPERGIPVRAWITSRQSGEQLVDGEATAWTDAQVHVRYVDSHGREGFVWLWAGAVRRR